MIALRNVTSRFLKGPTHRTVGPIGVHFARDAIHLVQLTNDQDNQKSLLAATNIPLSDTSGATQRNLKRELRKTLSKHRFRGTNVVSTMPPNKVRIFSVSFPSSSMSEAQSVLKAATERCGHDLSEYVVDYIPVRTQGRESDRLALVAVCSRQDVLEFLKTLDGLGFSVEGLEIGPVAIRRMVSAIVQHDHTQSTLVINFGDERSFLTTLSNRRLLADQTIEFGEKSLIDKLAKTLDMPDRMIRQLVTKTGLQSTTSSDGPGDIVNDTSIFNTVIEIVKPELLKLVDHIRRACLFAASETRGNTTNKIFILGSLARWTGAAELLSELTHMSVQTMPSPHEVFGDIEAHNNSFGTDYTVATGLALRGIENHA